jgi:type II secretory pathway component GspD/PulD (secretin)
MMQRQLIQQVFKAYEIDATVDDSVRTTNVRLDVDDVSFAQAAHVLCLLTDSFYVPIDTRHVMVARSTFPLREQFQHNAVATLSLAGLTTNEMTDMSNVARNVFEAQQAAVDPSTATLTLRSSATNIRVFNATLNDLMEGLPQVLLDVRVIQIAHNSERNTGAQLPQTIAAFNVYAEEQQILQQNASLVQQIISAGLAKPGDTLAILAILLASGQVSNSIFTNGFALFGGGLTLSGISPGPGTLNLNLNSSDSRELDDYQLRLGDGEEGTLKSGTRYPIMTSSFSTLGAGSLNIPGLSQPGTSGALGSLLSSVNSAVPNVPQVQYEDLGLVLKARPRVMRSGHVALTLDMKITALAGKALNNVPVLANRSYASVVTLGANEAFVVAAEIDKSESRAVSGMPGLSEIPGLNDVTDKDTQKNYATLLIIMTPYVVRNPHSTGRTPMMAVDRINQVR